MNGHGRGSRRDAAIAPIVALAATVLVVGGMLAIGSGSPEPTLSASADRDAQLVVNASGPTTTAPTHGFGGVSSRTVSAFAIASRM